MPSVTSALPVYSVAELTSLAPIGVTGSLDGAGGQPPVKRFAVVLRQGGNKIRCVTKGAKFSHAGAQ